jgi:NTP pyrophosphatase (non-canonical NTP hydrolase)
MVNKMYMNQYQFEATKTVIYPQEYKVMYPALGLASEAGEVAGKVKKLYRDKGGVLSTEDAKELAKEIGDICWYLAALAEDIGYQLGDIAQMNIDKLKDRQERGVLQGSGDNR